MKIELRSETSSDPTNQQGMTDEESMEDSSDNSSSHDEEQDVTN